MIKWHAPAVRASAKIEGAFFSRRSGQSRGSWGSWGPGSAFQSPTYRRGLEGRALDLEVSGFLLPQAASGVKDGP
jgi:hypothetical protein